MFRIDIPVSMLLTSCNISTTLWKTHQVWKRGSILRRFIFCILSKLNQTWTVYKCIYLSYRLDSMSAVHHWCKPCVSCHFDRYLLLGHHKTGARGSPSSVTYSFGEWYLKNTVLAKKKEERKKIKYSEYSEWILNAFYHGF